MDDRHVDRAGTMLGEDLDKYFVDIAASCPYGLEQRAVYHQAVFGWMDDQSMGHFLQCGYRRNGNCLYTMHCPTCSLCVPIRISPRTFQPNRNQKRVLKRNADVRAGMAPLTMSRENLLLLDNFLSSRFPGGKSDATGYYTGFFITTMTRCFEIRYRIGEQLMGVAIVDCAEGWMNAVYFYFDPKLEERSPGTFNILYLIEFCARQKIDQLYLGYWIDGLQGMDYKSRFKPHELLVDGRWQSVF